MCRHSGWQSGDAPCEWLVNAHLDSIETKSRFNFGLMILTTGLLAVGVATIALQWQKS